MYKFKRWLTDKYYSRNIDAPDYTYWCNRMAQAYGEGEGSTATTILEDYGDGLIWLSLSDLIVLQANLDEFERDDV